MQIEGLTYIPNYITKDELWSVIYQQSWLTDIKRRTQHYGYKYDYKARKTDVVEGKKMERSLRVSITFRKVILSSDKKAK